MRAAWYEKQGTAREVLIVGEMDDPQPRAGDVRIRIAASGINPGDVKKRQNAFGVGMPYPRVIPHSDGARVIDAVGEGVSQEWMVDASGAMVLKHTVRSARPPNTQSFHLITQFPCQKLCHSK
jgi:NADPH:quinone reductase-like Zn-dependent oxidoreductase